MFRFGEPIYLYFLVLIPLMAMLYWYYRRLRARRIARFGNPAMVARLMPDASYKRGRTKFVLVMVALGLIVVALARPQFGSKLREVHREGVEIMLVIDVSNSMLAEDFQPTRLERTKYAISRLIEQLSRDRIGMVVFAGDAYVQLPVTSDYVSAKSFVSHLQPGIVSKQGTALGKAIDLAASSFSSQSEGSRVMIVVSDGENHEDDPIAAAAAAAEKGIEVYTIGIGTPEGAPIPMDGDFMKDEEGNIVVTKLDEGILQEVAVTGGGAYIRATNQSVGLDEIIKRVREMQTKKFTSMTFEEYNDQYYYLLAIALVFLLLEFIVSDRKSKILARFSIFKDKSPDDTNL